MDCGRYPLEKELAEEWSVHDGGGVSQELT